MKLVSILTSLLLACALVLLLSADLASSRKLKLQGTRSKKKLARIARRLSGDTTTKMPKSVKVRNRKCQKKLPKSVRVLCFSTETEFGSIFREMRSPTKSSLGVEALSDISFASIACFDPTKMPLLSKADLNSAISSRPAKFVMKLEPKTEIRSEECVETTTTTDFESEE